MQEVHFWQRSREDTKRAAGPPVLDFNQVVIRAYEPRNWLLAVTTSEQLSALRITACVSVQLNTTIGQEVNFSAGALNTFFT